MKKSKPSLSRNSSTSDEPLNPLQAAAKQRTDSVVEKLRRAMATIEAEVEAHDGLYPFNKGRLTQAEVCRRAGISKVTLQGPLHKTTTKAEVDAWVARVTAGIVKGKKNVRKAVTDRAEGWKANLEAIAQQYHECQLELASVRSELQLVTAERNALLKQTGLKRVQ